MRGDPVYAAPVRRDTPSVGAPHGSLTEVELTWIEGRLEQWIRFGRIASERILSRSTKVIAFRPGATFPFVRWTSNDYGTVTSSIAHATAVAADAPYATMAFSRPGAALLHRIDSEAKLNTVRIGAERSRVGKTGGGRAVH